jgi:alkanesulfonate monooxygenase SsuD/methylene tetrahydromethanopterin reductase-like flavin-dependent oxidoreductase (luciferase family)
VRAACDAIGRDPATMRFTVATVVCAGRDEAEFRRRAVASGQDPDRARADAAAGTPDEVVERIHEYERAGAETVYLQYHTLDEPDHLELIGTEVVTNVGAAS